MSNKVYGFTGLTGGGTGKLDAIDGSVLMDGDIALGADASQGYTYQLVAASGAAESSPDVISPDTNAGTKRWLRRHDEQKAYRAASPTNGHLATVDADGDVVDSGRASTAVVNYVDRGDPAVVDYDQTVLTADGAFHDLDLSAIVPANAKAVVIRGTLNDDATGSTLILRENGNSNIIVSLISRTQVANVTIDFQGIVTVDANRVIEYQLTNVVFSSITLSVIGWFV